MCAQANSLLAAMGVAIALGFGLVVAQTTRPASRPDSPAVQAHIAAAMAAAKDDLVADAKAMCMPANRSENREVMSSAVASGTLRGSEPYPAVKLADNFYYFGRTQIGSHALVTSEGIILIDAINNAQDAEEAIIGGMKSVGLDPNQIKWLIITHDHGDHYGGAQYLRDHYHVRIVEGAPDWAGPGQDRGPPGWVPLGPKPKFQTGDIAVTDDTTLMLGDTTVTLVLTPGHTPGTLSMLYPVKIKGRTYTAMQWGGGVPNDYNSDSVAHFVNDFAKPQKVALQFGSHPMGDLPKMDALRKMPNGSNPFLEGEQRFSRRLEIILQCNAAAADRKAGR